MRRTTVIAALLAATLLAAQASASNDPLYQQQWGLHRIGAESAWARGTGTGIVIAVVDTGADLQHEDLAVSGKIVQGHNFQDNNSNPQDQNGHGTHVSGIAAAATNNGKGVAGTAPSAKIMPVKVLNDLGFDVTVSLIQRQRAAQGIRWAVDHGAKVVNLSLGPVAGQGPGTEMGDAIRYAWSKGVVSVAAAGNDDGADSGYTDEPALVVAATQSGDGIAGYSNRVGKAMWGISAPGSGIMSTYYDLVSNDHRSYRTLSGTSMAAPHVAGAVAVLLSMGLSPREAVNRILSSADDLGSSGYDSTFGAGRLNLARAVGASAPQPPAQSQPGAPGTSGPSQEPGGTSDGSSGGPQAQDEGPAEAAASPSPGGSPSSGDRVSDAGGPAEEEDGGNLPLNIAIALALVFVVGGSYAWVKFRASRHPG